MRALIAATLLATACTPAVRLVPPPVELLACADEPTAPDLEAVDWQSVETARPMQRERDVILLGHVLSLRSAWGDCRAKVDGVKAWADEVR